MREITSNISKLFESPWRQTALVAALFLLLTLLFTFPLAQRLTTHIPGYSGDINYYYWSNWWFGEAMGRGMNPWWTDTLWHPNGTSLIFSTNRFVSGLFGWLIEPLTGQIFAYNIVLLLSFVASALGVYLFARELTGNSIAAFAAAFIFAFNPWKFHKLQAHHFLMSTWFFGFALWMLMRILQKKEKSIKHGILLAVFAAITLYESLFLFNLLLLSSALITLLFALFDRPRFWRASTLKGLLATGLTFIVLATPMIIMIAVALPEYGSLPYAAGGEQFSTDLLNVIWPSPMPWSGFGTHPKELWTEATHHYRGHDENFGPFGWVLIPLTFVGWWVGRRKNKAFADVSLICVLFFAVLSLGPSLHIAGSDTGIPLPYHFLSWLPPIRLVRTPSRFIIIAFLFAGLLAAMAIAHIARMKRWKRAGLLSTALVTLLLIDYMPHGSATQDQRIYPKPMAALAEVDGDFAAMPFGYYYIQTMRYAPVHGKSLTTGYVARGTLFSRPIQDFLYRYGLSLLSARDKAPESPRIAKMGETFTTILRSANVGAILHLGSEDRLNTLTGLLNGEILDMDGDHGVILLPESDPLPTKLTLNAETLPPMRSANIGGGMHAEQLWTGYNGFRLTIPRRLMPEGRIDLTISSAIRDLTGRQHFLLVTVNGSLVARIELSHANTTYTVSLPDNIRELPMNISAITQELEAEENESPLPFEINALSGNRPAGNFSALYVNAQELLPYKHRNATVLLSTLDESGSTPETHEFPIHAEEFAERFQPAFRDALAQPWVVLMTCGEISPAAAELVENLATEAGMEVDRRDIRARSFVVILNTKARKAIVHSAREGYVQVINGPINNPATPTINIKEMAFR